MSLEQAILTHAEAVNRLAAALENRGDEATPPAETPKAAKPKAEKPKADEPAAEVETNTAGGEVKEISGTATGVATGGTTTTVDVPTLAAKVTSLVGAGKRAEVVALLKKYDAAKAGEVAEEKRGEFYAELEAIG